MSLVETKYHRVYYRGTPSIMRFITDDRQFNWSYPILTLNERFSSYEDIFSFSVVANISQGTDYDERVGSQVSGKSIRMRGRISASFRYGNKTAEYEFPDANGTQYITGSLGSSSGTLSTGVETQDPVKRTVGSSMCISVGNQPAGSKFGGWESNNAIARRVAVDTSNYQDINSSARGLWTYPNTPQWLFGSMYYNGTPQNINLTLSPASSAVDRLHYVPTVVRFFVVHDLFPTNIPVQLDEIFDPGLDAYAYGFPNIPNKGRFSLVSDESYMLDRQRPFADINLSVPFKAPVRYSSSSGDTITRNNVYCFVIRYCFDVPLGHQPVATPIILNSEFAYTDL